MVDSKARENYTNVNFDLDPSYLEKLDIIEIGALNGEIVDETHHFETFFPSLEKFLKAAVDSSHNPNKTMNMNYLDYGIQVPDELGKESEAIDYVLPFYNSIDSRSGLDWRNVMPITIIPAALGAFGAILINPNLVTSKYGKRANELEIRVVKSLAKLLGYKDIAKTWGIATEGGTKGNMYGYIIGLRKAFPQIKEEGLMGIEQKFVFANSQAGHFSNFTNLAAIGTGRKHSVRIAADANGCMDVGALREVLEKSHAEGTIIPTILCTIGTTDACAVDDVKAVYDVVEEMKSKYNDFYRPHIHLDAAIGWSLVFFNDYDLEANKNAYSEDFLKRLKLVQAKMQNIHYADSISLDIHKTGFTPYSSSFFIVKDQADFELMKWDASEFKYFDPSQSKIAPVQYTLECTRSSVGIYSTAMALNTLGVEGYQILLSAGLQYVTRLKQKFASFGNIGVLNDHLGFTCLFRPYPSFVTNADELIYKEKHDPQFQKASQALSEFGHDFYNFWQLHKKPDSPLLDHVDAALWAQYGDRDYELSSWKAYMLNPRVGKHIEAFLEEFLSLRLEYERQLPKDYLEELRSLLS